VLFLAMQQVGNLLDVRLVGRSDMGRPPDGRAGYTLLEAIRGSGDQTPYFIYASSRDPAHVREAQTRGAQGMTNMGDELLQMLLQALNTEA
jgi:hypothetical protein